MDKVWALMERCQSYQVVVHHRKLEYQARGCLKVDVTENQLLIHEVGQWVDGGIRVENIWRWQLDQGELLISRWVGQQSCDDTLARFTEPGQSIMHYYCGQDDYHAELRLVDNQLQLQWTIQGPQKNMILAYSYH